MTVTILEGRRVTLARQIDRMKTGRLNLHMIGENGTSAHTIRTFEQALVNLDYMIAAKKRKLS
jgi:hypothetical protein